MSDVAFTPEERALLMRRSGRSQDMGSRIAFYLAILLPMVAFAIYGLVRRDVVAIAIAFGGILLYQLWTIAYEFARVETYRSLMTKLAEREANNILS